MRLFDKVDWVFIPGAPKISTRDPKLEKYAMLSFASEAPTVQTSSSKAGDSFDASG